MDSFNESSLSAYFPGLVDVCSDDDGQLVYAILKDGELVLEKEYITEAESFSIPEKKHFQFTIPRAAEVLRYFGQEDTALYDDLLSYLKRFSALDDEQWAIVAHYVFLTYLHDHPGIDYCAYILFNAVPERGKSRTGKSIIHVAFRGIHLIELREATIFRYSQYLHGTLFFDLVDISKKVREFLKRTMERIENGTFKFAEAFPGASEAEKAYFTQHEGREYRPEPHQVLFGEYVKEWMETTFPSFSSSTKRRDYREAIETRILPHFKNVSFYQMTSTTVFNFTGTLIRSQGREKGKPLSTSRKVNILIPLRAIWNDACDYYRWLLKSPFDNLNKATENREERARRLSF